MDGPPAERACAWQAREPVILPGGPVSSVGVIGSRSDTVAVVFGDFTEQRAVERWRWNAEPTGGGTRRLPFGRLAHGPDEAVAVVARGEDEGSYVLVEEDGTSTVLDALTGSHENGSREPEVGLRWLGPQEADGRRLLLTDSPGHGQAVQARRILGDPSEDIGSVACGAAAIDVLTRDGGYLAAVATSMAMERCREWRVWDRVIEIIALDGGREVRHIVPPREGLSPPIYVGDVRLLDTEGGPTLLWHDGQEFDSFNYLFPDDVVGWLQPLDPSGRPLGGEAVALPPGWGGDGVGAAAIGDAVALIGMDEGNFVIRLVARDGTLEETLPLPLEWPPYYGGPVNLVASPDARTLVVAASQSQGVTVLHYDCVDPGGS